MNRNFYLSSLEIPVTEEYDFSYAGVSGYAEVIGCKIAFFSQKQVCSSGRFQLYRNTTGRI